MKEKALSTRTIHSGGEDLAKKIAKSVSVPKVLPIYMSSVFSFDDVPSLEKLYEGEASGYVYSRMENPSTEAVCEILAAAESTAGAIAFSSGMAAITTAILAYVGAGDHIVSSPVLYGGVYDFLLNEIKRFGVEVSFVDFDHGDLEKAIRPNTKLIYTETISNPLMEVADIPRIAEIAHRHNCKFVIDNTFATPAVARPLDFGADVSVYSTTKFLGGHSDIIGGALCANNEEIARIKRLSVLYGNIMSPFDAWLLARSLRTLDLRVAKHSENARQVAEFFAGHPKIEKVYYPGLKCSPYYERGQKLLIDGRCGGMLSADIAGGEAGAAAFIKACESIKFVPSLAGVSTTISYPAKTSHRAYSPEELKKAGISTGQLRFSIGLEEIGDILAEFDAALAKC
ncbi:MAG: aminotransferase class I/II-fold pyridoxal phosphate-dependent enzyme [Fusobacteriaceae bacterium]|jgi:methionine-gamma-lyase|nr:aminotransferase class I/II-fold pyridoxal phosphate-dependent enzyme [Fusobacteriaceae bacterium]